VRAAGRVFARRILNGGFIEFPSRKAVRLSIAIAVLRLRLQQFTISSRPSRFSFFARRNLSREIAAVMQRIYQALRRAGAESRIYGDKSPGNFEIAAFQL